jgi:N-carbamoyl-L-amino-acid hydrolase
MNEGSVNRERLAGRIRQLGDVGREDGKLTRLAASDADRAGRDLFVSWRREAELDGAIDRIGNIFCIWNAGGDEGNAPILIGSQVDTAINAGIYDGCYCVLAGLELIETLGEGGFAPSRPIAVAAFTNEKGVRYAPDGVGSLVVYVGGLSVDDALSTVGTDGSVLGERRLDIGYPGTQEPWFLEPHVYLELHIEQGPVLEREDCAIGAVKNLQRISWQRITVDGVANNFSFRASAASATIHGGLLPGPILSQAQTFCLMLSAN